MSDKITFREKPIKDPEQKYTMCGFNAIAYPANKEPMTEAEWNEKMKLMIYKLREEGIIFMGTCVPKGIVEKE